MSRLVRSTAIALALAAPLSSRAAAVELGFSARLADAGTPVAGSHTFVVKLFDVATGGVPLWTESHASVEVLGGVAHLVLGSATALDDALLNGAPLFVELAVDATTLAPRLEVLPGAYAIHATKAGSALTCSSAETASTLGTLAPADVQRRIAGACPAGSSIQSIDATGAVACEADDLGVYAAGFGLSLTGNTFAVNTDAVQRRIDAACPPASTISAIDALGQVTCTAETLYSAGSGLTLDGTTLAVDGTLVARKDGAAGPQSFDGGTLYVDSTNDRVGVLNTSPTTALDVIGTASATDFAYRAPRAGTYWLPPSAFQAVGSGTAGYATDHIYPVGAGQLNLRAPLNLPEGVTLTAVTCEIYDWDSSRDLTTGGSGAWVSRRAFGSTSTTTPLSTTFGTSGATDAIQTRTGSGSAVVDSGGDWYVTAFLQALPSPDASGATYIRFYGCRVSYTSPGPR
jgi:hypothetical protein